MEIKMLKLGDVKPYEKNPRQNDGAVEYVANSIKEFGFKVPIIVDKDNVIVCGHTRYKAAKQLGLKTVPTISADDLTPEQVNAYRLADNKVSEMAGWDFELLNDELADIDFDMSEFGFEDAAADTEDMEAINDDGVEETKSFDYTLKFGKTTVIMTEEEYNKLLQRYNDYSDDNGVSFGFVSSLLEG